MTISLSNLVAPSASAILLKQMQRWASVGALRVIDVALAGFILEQQPNTHPLVLLAVALTSERNSHGHVCLDLTEAQQQPLLHAVATELGAVFGVFTVAEWLRELGASDAVWDRLHGAADDGATPLVLAGTSAQPLLYLRRYWRDEQQIIHGIHARLQQVLSVSEPALERLLTALFPATDHLIPWEKIASALAARRAFAIITGGPGTGKTTTVVRLLALLQGLTFDANQPPLRIRLAAPTGKAAARLNASIAGRIADLPLANLANGEQIRSEIPTAVTTLHRLLEPLPHSRHFRYHAGNRLPVDLVVVDEASMVDVEMMARLLEALRPEARLILLGDKDQLASVEAGAVLGDLCAGAAAAHYTPATRDWLQRVTGATLPMEYIDPAGRALAQVTVMLRHSYRFHADGGIGALAALVNAETSSLAQLVPNQRLNAALQLFTEESVQTPAAAKQLTAIRLSKTQSSEFIDLVCNGYSGYLTAMHDGDPGDAAAQTAVDAWAHTVLAAQAAFQILAVLREGIWGVAGLNQQIVALLQQKNLLRVAQATSTPSPWFAGRPVLVTRNDANLRLMNGDIGITLAVPVHDAEQPHQTRRVLRVAFPVGNGSGGIRWVLPSRLQAVETVFAMTVHKSQGSEFAHTALVLPDAVNPVLTQELLYTAITRSKQQFTLLYSEPSVLGEALCRRVARISGIANALMMLNIDDNAHSSA